MAAAVGPELRLFYNGTRVEEFVIPRLFSFKVDKQEKCLVNRVYAYVLQHLYEYVFEKNVDTSSQSRKLLEGKIVRKFPEESFVVGSYITHCAVEAYIEGCIHYFYRKSGLRMMQGLSEKDKRTLQICSDFFLPLLEAEFPSMRFTQESVKKEVERIIKEINQLKQESMVRRIQLGKELQKKPPEEERKENFTYCLPEVVAII